MPYLSEVYTVGGLIMMLFLASRAASGGGDSEGPSPSVAELRELLILVREDESDVVAS